MTDPRPKRLSHTDIGEHIAEVRETDDVYRLYRPEWITVFAATGTDATRMAEEFFALKYAGRVYERDVRYVVLGSGVTAMVQLRLRLPNVVGEFKYAHLAQQHAETHGFDDYRIVARNSKDDHDIRSYGVRRLPR